MCACMSLAFFGGDHLAHFNALGRDYKHQSYTHSLLFFTFSPATAPSTRSHNSLLLSPQHSNSTFSPASSHPDPLGLLTFVIYEDQ